MITFGYLCSELDKVFGIRPNKDEKFSLNELIMYIEDIYRKEMENGQTES